MITFLRNLISHSPNELISYAEYMSAVLYHPELGYYMKDTTKIGKQGDFITTSNVSDIYGRMAAKWFSNICQKTKLPPVFCELGGGTGRFANSFLKEWQESSQLPIKYIIVESSPYHRKLQSELLYPDFSFVQAVSLNEVEPFRGMVFSNELFDALPVHVIEKIDGQLFEVMIGINDDGQLIEQNEVLTNKAILTFLSESNLVIKEKQRIEIPLAMEKMIEDISNVLIGGLVVTADYGYTNEEWANPIHKMGSLRGYHQHSMINDVLKNPGEMDITTHIHFDYLVQKGTQHRLALLTKLRQDEFLLKAGILKELENHYDPNPFSEVSRRNRAIRSLIMPSGMSAYFHVIIQQKDLLLRQEDLFIE
ncbi:class I SAM-dependent methyltransferase [Neobacillus cucumis]|uniref:SAM-dependent methyltransferase n=1 Tax=Neobacillus cucumis TaxID=1740721 RepID=A0A2N5H8B4_9BACI|nr:SAM-dependent methyltransferase [Neobacillus cucumis]PLS01751.1 SAM-dependent methyltransferase [Neobacillus cucumis]